MTPKEKAKEIYGKFFRTTPQPYSIIEVNGVKFDDWDRTWTTNMAKEQAMLCIDEILNFMEIDDNDSGTCHNANSKWVNYWLLVKNEIILI